MLLSFSPYLTQLELRQSSWERAPLSRHRRGRKTETSSDASQEAPERARKDTPKEVKLHEGSYPSVRLYKRSFSGFLATLPMAAGSGGRGATALPTVATSATAPAREICLPLRFGFLLFALAILVYQKIRPAGENCRGANLSAAGRPGSLNRTLLVSVLIYEQGRRI